MSKNDVKGNEEEEQGGKGNEEEEQGGEEVTLEEVLYRFVGDINKQIENCDTTLKEIEDTTDTVRDMVYAELQPGELPPELKEHEKFRKALDRLHIGVGSIIEYVIRLEKSRKKVEEYIPEEELTEKEPETKFPMPVSVSVTSPPQGQGTPIQYSGYWAARAEVRKAEIQATLERERMYSEQSVVTTKQVVDIVQTGRQMIPALNKVKKWIPCALAQTRQYGNDRLYFLLHQEVGTYLSQTLGNLVSWVSACFEYRKNLLQGRKLGMARAFARIAEAQSYGPKVISSGAFAPKGYGLGSKGFQERR